MTAPRLTMHHVEWACRECDKQRSGEKSVAWMLSAWVYACQGRHRVPTMKDIVTLGQTVEPRRSYGGLRRINVSVGGDLKMKWQMVEGHLNDLLAAWHRLPSDEWYRMYEEIHPFPDGNGRTGNILWNWHRKGLIVPLDPPDFWGDGLEDLELAAFKAIHARIRREGGQI